MIKPGEISKLAGRIGVRDKQIEKDYVITWVLKGISEDPFLSQNLIFKGGTCLKKIHFENYRFSEDMDFSLKDDSIGDQDIIAAFNRIFEKIFEDSRIKLSIDKEHWIHQSTGSINFYITYTGPLGGTGNDIKVDITRGETFQFDPVLSPVFRSYSDLEEDFSILSYTKDEILIEKMVALMGRTVPRDLYDFYYLTAIDDMDINYVLVDFEAKARNKGHDPKKILQLDEKESKYRRDWETNLKHQIKDLEDFNSVWRVMKREIKKLGYDEKKK